MTKFFFRDVVVDLAAFICAENFNTISMSERQLRVNPEGGGGGGGGGRGGGEAAKITTPIKNISFHSVLHGKGSKDVS